MSGLIGLPCNESARYSEMYYSAMSLELPKDWSIAPSGNTRMPIMQVRFASLAASLNTIGRIFMKTGREWLFLMNDDHVYPPDTLIRLLSHDKDFVTGLYLKKQMPFDPIIYDKIENGRLVPKLLKDYESGLVPIVGCGDGCLLIRRKVLEAIPEPWWEMSDPETPDLITQDLIFCRKVREAGFQMYCDLDAFVTHLAIVPVAPTRENGKWGTVLLGPDPSGDLRLPAAQPAPELVET